MEPLAQAAALHVAKIGGSLLDLDDLPARLTHWLRQADARHVVLIVGGGQAVEQLRRQDRAAPIDPAAAHWACIDRMADNTRALALKLPGVPLVELYETLAGRLTLRGATLFVATEWLRTTEPHLPGTRLPIGWQTTSDAIAGRLAIALHADALILLKSASPPADIVPGLPALAECGLIDEVLVSLGGELRSVQLVDFRK